MVRYDARDDDLDEMTAPELQLTIQRIREKLRELAAERGNARCHSTLHELIHEFLPEGDASWCGLADKQAFLTQCERFWENGQCPSQKGVHACPTCRGAGVIPPA